jgi:hypothetical protein
VYSRNPDSSTLEPDRQQHDRPVACVAVSQQWCCATLISLPYLSRQQKLGAGCKNVILQLFLLAENGLNLKLCKSGNV